MRTSQSFKRKATHDWKGNPNAPDAQTEAGEIPSLNKSKQGCSVLGTALPGTPVHRGRPRDPVLDCLVGPDWVVSGIDAFSSQVHTSAKVSFRIREPTVNHKRRATIGFCHFIRGSSKESRAPTRAIKGATAGVTWVQMVGDRTLMGCLGKSPPTSILNLQAMIQLGDLGNLPSQGNA